MFTEFSSLIAEIQLNSDRRARRADESLPWVGERSTTGINGGFLHSQLLIGVIVQMRQTTEAFNEIISYCKIECADNKVELAILKEYKKTYSPWKALWWYTRESFLYRLLNKALRTQDVDALFIFRFFIRDIRNQLDQCRCTMPMNVYRGQVMSRDEIKALEKSIGLLISINSFFSTTLKRERALSFLRRSGNDLCRVLFEIEADPRCTTTKPFAHIASLSFYPSEDEVLFMLGSIFRVISINRNPDDIYIIQLRLCRDDDHDLKKIFQHMKDQIVGFDNTLAFANVLLQMGKFDHAEKYYRLGLQQITPNNPGAVYYYHGLGLVEKEKGDYASSFDCLNKALELYNKLGNQSSIASIHNSIGALHTIKHNYKQALESYTMALVIYKGLHGENHLDVATCFNNLGAVYYEEKKYMEALEFYEKASKILQKNLPADHPQLGGSYNNIGNIQLNLGHYIFALEYYHLALSIKEKTLPSEHPSIGTTHKSIGLAHEHSGDLKQALIHYQKAATIFHQCFSADHPSVKDIEQYLLRLTSSNTKDKST